MAIKSSLSGFPELLPQDRAIELAIVDRIREAFTLYGFCDVESRCVEPETELLAKGETSKEIYLLQRLQADGAAEAGGSTSSKKRIGLRFDLTVPFARYIRENAGHLQFPFRRMTIGKVWRGERPQDGRFREFVQADVDIIAQELPGQTAALPLHFDVDVVKTVASALRSLEDLGAPKATIHINNRKLLQGAYQLLETPDVEETLRIVDKLDKIGADEVINQLVALGFTEVNANTAIKLAAITATNSQDLQSLLSEVFPTPPNAQHSLFQEGITELSQMLDALQGKANVIADLKIARGLDYYTGSVFETTLDGFERYGSISSGGRYDKLASTGKVNFPGVGMSIGITRLTSILLANEQVAPQRSCPTQVYVAVNTEDTRHLSDDVADILRARGISTETSPSAVKFGKQIDAADKKGIPYVWFIGENGTHQVKNIITGEQSSADPHSWVKNS